MMTRKKNNSFKELNANSATETTTIQPVRQVGWAPKTQKRLSEMETMEWSNPGSLTLLWVHPLKRTSIKSSRTKSSCWGNTTLKVCCNQTYTSKDYWWNTRTFILNAPSELFRNNYTSKRFNRPRKSSRDWFYGRMIGLIWIKAMSFLNKWKKNWEL
jgi:hypothetical protein